MSDQLSFSGAFRPIDCDQAAKAQAQSLESDRRRALVRYHAHEEPIQRMLNAIEPDSYVRPHRHQDPPKLEIFLALKGRGVLLAFDEAGHLKDFLELNADGPCWGAEIPSGTWHSLISLDAGSVFYEIIEGPYHPATHKDFAPWAPPEGSPSASAYLQQLKEQLS